MSKCYNNTCETSLLRREVFIAYTNRLRNLIVAKTIPNEASIFQRAHLIKTERALGLNKLNTGCSQLHE